MNPVNTKVGVSAVANRKETNVISKDSGIKNMSANDEQKLNGKRIDEVLNQIADPNWVDPSKKVRTVGDQQMDKNAFMKLMLTQMKNQDPMNPIQAHEMAAQLAAFTSVEQLQNLNTTMQDMKKEQSPVVNFEALNFIGKSVSGDSSEIIRQKDDKTHELKFVLQKEAADVSIKIRNAEGDVVRTLELKDIKPGNVNQSWNGQDEKGMDAPPGNYQFFVDAKDKFGNKLVTETKFDGAITGVNFSPQGPVLMVGNQTVRLADIKKIIDPRQNDQKEKPIAAPDLQKHALKDENKKEDIKKEEAKIEEIKKEDNKKSSGAVESNLKNVSMARTMAEKVEKGTGKEVTI